MSLVRRTSVAAVDGGRPRPRSGVTLVASETCRRRGRAPGRRSRRRAAADRRRGSRCASGSSRRAGAREVPAAGAHAGAARRQRRRSGWSPSTTGSSAPSRCCPTAASPTPPWRSTPAAGSASPPARRRRGRSPRSPADRGRTSPPRSPRCRAGRSAAGSGPPTWSQVNGVWILYFSAEVAGLGLDGRCIGAATATDPTQTFVPDERPLVCPKQAVAPAGVRQDQAARPGPAQGAASSTPSYFQDRGGNRYLLYRTQGTPSTIRIVAAAGQRPPGRAAGAQHRAGPPRRRDREPDADPARTRSTC